VIELHIKADPVSNVKMLSLFSLLSKYDLFHISADNGREFNATEIVGDNAGYMEFKRLFANSVHSNGYVVDIQAISEIEFICKTSSVVYHISALHTKQQDSIIRERKIWKEISDLMCVDYFGDRLISYVKELDMLILVVDPSLLGELHPMEQRQIQHIINVYLNGYSDSMQMSRTVCFQIKLHDGRNRIYAGVYDLEGQNSITSIPIYDDRDKEIIADDLYNKAQGVLKYAKEMAVKFSFQN
jgi:hypothetical protein